MKNNKIQEIESAIGYSNEIYNIKNMKKYGVLLLIVEVEGELSFVFQVRNREIRQGGEISLPGGRYELEDMNTHNTAIRETKEEMGISEEDIEIIGKLDSIISHGNIFVDSYVGYTSKHPDEFKINKSEVESIFTIPIDYFIENRPVMHEITYYASPYMHNPTTDEKIILLPAEELGLPEKYSKMWNQHNVSIPFYKTEIGLIWGLTAQIVMFYCNTIDGITK